MRRTLAATVVAAVAALVVTGLAAPASAVCGGGQPGEPCYCPNLKVVKVYC
ncbi:MAG: hypothetical protein QOE45_2462 [Frankiaceae bacterium]|jgi:hypothetical protein|nr:hypothetical protein [Frankiaceae bacterium]